MGMMMYYVGAAVLLAMAALCWWLAVRLNAQTAMAEQQSLAQEQLGAYRLRLKTLAQEVELNELDDAEYQATANDLKRQLLHDLTVQKTDGSAKKLSLFLPGMTFLLLFVGVFYYINGEAGKLHDWQLAKQSLPAFAKRAFMGEGESLSPKELQQLALGLRTKLHDNGDDSEAWMAFGRVAMAINDSESALLAFEKAYRLRPGKSAVAVSYAQALLMTTDPDSTRKASALLSKILQVEPENIQALILVTYIAEQNGELDKALLGWRVIQSKLKPEDPRYGFISEKLAQAQMAPADGASRQATTKTSSKGNIEVTLTLAESLQGKLPPNATLFVYAKAAQGRPVPAAVVKLTQFNLPMTVQLSDANAMLQNYTLSSLDNVIIWARVSLDGDIGISAGELQGQSEVLNVSETQSVTVVINQIL